MPHRPRHDVAEEFWHYLTHKAGIPPPLTRKAWRALRHTQEVVTWRFTLEHALSTWGAVDPLTASARPFAVMEALEECVRRRQLSRKDANHLEESLLRLVSKEGQWK